MLNKHLFIMDFGLGKPANLYDKNNPDWIPSKQMGYTTNKNLTNNMSRYQRLQNRLQRVSNIIQYFGDITSELMFFIYFYGVLIFFILLLNYCYNICLLLYVLNSFR